MHKEIPRRLRPGLVRGLSAVHEPTLDYPIRPASVTECRADGGFWGARIETHRSATLPHAWDRLQHNVENFRRASGRSAGSHSGLHWDDSDLYKVMEGAAYALAAHPDLALEARLADLVETVAAAQEPDGYLYTARTLDPADPAPGAGPTRWSFMPGSHELYCMGHMIEAAVAHHEATGRRTFLNVALLCANLLAATFGPAGIRDVCGHPEIEMALARLYRTTGDPRFLRLCRFFLDERGRHESRKSYGEAEQDHRPVLEQAAPVGHAVRATYLYSAMTDVAAMQDDERFAMASERLWREVVETRLALTGAVGARHDGEAFGDPYELPNLDPHNETCAAVGLMLWSHRLFLLNGDARYLDVLERVLYNAYLASHSLDGQGFFYCNPLAVGPGGASARPDWQGCACCPSNVVRITPQVPSWAVACRGRTLYVCLYLDGTAELSIEDEPVRMTQQTRYPWDGVVTLTVETLTDRPIDLDLALRIPRWATGQPVPGDLYRYLDARSDPFTVTVEGEPVSARVEKGFAIAALRLLPKAPQVVMLSLPTPIRRVVPHERIEATAGRIALERGPIVYCVEAVDHGGGAGDLGLPDAADLRAEHRADLLGGVTVVRSAGAPPEEDSASGPGTTSRELFAVPYYAWNNRGPGEMAVWMRRGCPAADSYDP